MTRRTEEQAIAKKVLAEVKKNTDLVDLDANVVANVVARCRIRDGGMGVDACDIWEAMDWVVEKEWQCEDPQSVMCAAADFFDISHDAVCH
jgi:hypothetical protein